MPDPLDLVIIGSGPGGYVAAIRAAQLGLSVAIVEREKLGGICLNWGCIPTKALLRTAEVYHQMTHAEQYGLRAAQPTFDIAAVVDRSRKVAGQLNAGVRSLMKKNKIAVHHGVARLAAADRVVIEGEGGTTELAAKAVLVATGARARELPFAPADGERIWTYRHAMVPTVMPTDLLVIGSGAIGIEFASFYRDMGADVTVVEMLPRILPVEDAAISAHMLKRLIKDGMTIHTEASVEALDTGTDGVTARIRTNDGQTLEHRFSQAIIAVGIVPNTEDIGLDALGVATDRGHIVVDEFGRTNVPGVLAIGDVTGAPWLAHKASHEGVVAVEKLAGGDPHPFSTWNIPGCTYARPQVASVGLTEAAARETGHEVKVGQFPLIGNGKAIALGEADGFVKTVFDAATGELLGAHMIGAEVTELIGTFVVARQLETTEAELMETVFAHPTISESLHESVLDAYDRVIHF